MYCAIYDDLLSHLLITLLSHDRRLGALPAGDKRVLIWRSSGPHLELIWRPSPENWKSKLYLKYNLRVELAAPYQI